MKTIFNITGAVALTALATTANAASFSLSAPASVNVGDSFNVTVFGDFTGDNVITYGVDLGFDPALFTVTGSTYDVAFADPGFSCQGGACPGEGPGLATVSAGNFGGLGDLTAGSVATFTLTANAAGVSAITVDNSVTLATTSANFGFGAVPGVVGDSASIEVLGGAVVPVPAAVWLFGSGLLGLVGVARRKA